MCKPAFTLIFYLGGLYIDLYINHTIDCNRHCTVKGVIQ